MERQVGHELCKMLKQADMERRFKEAEATIAELKPGFEKADAEMQKK